MTIEPHRGARLSADNPWPGLAGFGEDATRFFNGRDEERAALLRLVRDAPLTVLFGRSGLGKTSLLQAGVFPSLRHQGFLPISVRIDPRATASPLINQVKQAFTRELELQKVDHPRFRPEETLWMYLHRADLELWSPQNRLLTPVLVCDQFEELFTIGARNVRALRLLREDLADLIENRIPGPLARRIDRGEADASTLRLQRQRYKILFSLREDYLPELELWRREIPSLNRSRFRLLPMNGAQAYEAVFKTGAHLVDEAIAREIVAFVAAARAELKSFARSRTRARGSSSV